jgi:hypothetical protein
LNTFLSSFRGSCHYTPLYFVTLIIYGEGHKPLSLPPLCNCLQYTV